MAHPGHAGRHRRLPRAFRRQDRGDRRLHDDVRPGRKIAGTQWPATAAANHVQEGSLSPADLRGAAERPGARDRSMRRSRSGCSRATSPAAAVRPADHLARRPSSPTPGPRRAARASCSPATPGSPATSRSARRRCCRPRRQDRCRRLRAADARPDDRADRAAARPTSSRRRSPATTTADPQRAST